MKPVVIGEQNFAALRKRNAFYVDKTGFIKDWWENGSTVTILLRPRRFGKTLLLDTVNKFFSVEYKNQPDLFEGLSIMEDEKMAALRGTMPVISLTFADVKEATMADAMEQIKSKIWDLFRRYSAIIDFSKLTEDEQAEYKLYNRNISDKTASGALNFLSSILEKCYQEKVILLLDEYDSPLIEAYTNGYWEELITFMKKFFNSSFKTNSSMYRVLMTGINRISKQSLFSDFNNAKIYGILNNRYTTCCGFTQEEVDQALKDYNLFDQRAAVKAHYDGFIIGSQKEIYNPWSFTNYLESGLLDDYWVNTSSNKLVSTILFKGNNDLKLQFEHLLTDKPIEITIEENLDFENLENSTDAIWSLFYTAGYLKAEVIDYAKKLYAATITNGETKNMFYSMVTKWFNTRYNYYQGFCKALLADDLDEMNEQINKLTLEVTSHYDMANQPESYYHGLFIGLMITLMDDFAVTSNRESGLGRYDVQILANDKSKGILVELKKFGKGDATLEDTVQRALEQMEINKYETELLKLGVKPENIYKYGFAFKDKEVLIAKGE